MTAFADTDASWQVRGSQHHFDGGVISVRTDSVVMPDGGTAQRDVVEHPGAVGVIALDADDRILVIRQYRHAPGRLLWEPPAGLLDVSGEPPLVAAQRELFEEAAHRAEEWRVLVDGFTSPGFTDEAYRVYLARGLREVAVGERHVGRHEEADLQVGWLPLDECVRLVLAGRLHNPLLIAGALAAWAARSGSGYDALRPGGDPWPERPVPG